MKTKEEIARLKHVIVELGETLEKISDTDIINEEDMKDETLAHYKWLMKWRHRTKDSTVDVIKKHKDIIEECKKVDKT
jgi:hypothetical protein